MRGLYSEDNVKPFVIQDQGGSPNRGSLRIGQCPERVILEEESSGSECGEGHSSLFECPDQRQRDRESRYMQSESTQKPKSNITSIQSPKLKYATLQKNSHYMLSTMDNGLSQNNGVSQSKSGDSYYSQSAFISQNTSSQKPQIPRNKINRVSRPARNVNKSNLVVSGASHGSKVNEMLRTKQDSLSR